MARLTPAVIPLNGGIQRAASAAQTFCFSQILACVGMTMLLLTLTLPLTACAVKGSLKTPSQVEQERLKKKVQ